MKKILVGVVFGLFWGVVQASYGSLNQSQPSPQTVLTNKKTEIVITEQFLLQKLKQESEQYKNFYLNLHGGKNDKQPSELNQEKKIEDKQSVSGKESEEVLYKKILLALDTYTGDLRALLEEVKETVGNSINGVTMSSTQLGTIAKSIKQVKTVQKKPKWNYSGIIGNGLHLGQFGALGFLIYYLLTTLKK